MKTSVLRLTMVLSSLQATSALAEIPAPLREVNQTVSVQIGALGQDYFEHDDYGEVPTDYLDREDGTLGALALEGRWLKDAWFYQAQVRLATGETNYDGYLQNLNTGEITPHQSTTDNLMQTARVSIGYLLPIGGALALIPGAEIGSRFWNRSLQGIGGYDEQYFDVHAGLSLTAQAALSERLVASLQAAGGSTVYGMINVDSVDLREELGRKPYYRLGAGLDYRLDARWHLKADLAYERFGYGESNVSEYNGKFYREPRSRTRQQSVLVGVGYRF